jgi:hypothetical protein
MSGGLSFACPHRASRDCAYRRFVDSAPEDVFNAWPELAGLKSYEQARTQPLLRVVYVPSFRLGEYDSTLEKKIERLHEAFHVHFDLTPAKTLARILLIPIYSNLHFIMGATDWNTEAQKCWNSLVKLNSRLVDLFELLSPSEELLVTASSFNEAQYRLKVDPASLVPIEQRHVAYLSELLRALNFEIPIDRLYYGTFKKLAQWMGEESRHPKLVHLVATFLQGIRSKSEYGLEDVDAKERIKLLHENIQNIKNGYQFVNWLIDIIPVEEIEASFAAHATHLQAIIERQELMPWAQWLWIVTHGKRAPQPTPKQVLRDPLEATLRATEKIRLSTLNRTHCMLFLYLLNKTG